MRIGTQSASAADDERCPRGIAIGAGALFLIGTAIVVAVATRAAVPTHAVVPRAIAMCVAVGLFAVVADDGVAALTVAGLAWLITDGFLLNQFGVLTWQGSVDVGLTLGLLGGASLGTAIAEARRELAERREWQPVIDLLSEVADDGVELAGESAARGAPASEGYGRREPVPTDVRTLT